MCDHYGLLDEIVGCAPKINNVLLLNQDMKTTEKLTSAAARAMYQRVNELKTEKNIEITQDMSIE